MKQTAEALKACQAAAKPAKAAKSAAIAKKGEGDAAGPTSTTVLQQPVRTYTHRQRPAHQAV